jgi:hypothetical protein
MSKFQIGLLVGFFLGGLSLFVVLGIIHLYCEKRRTPSSSGPDISSGGGARADPVRHFPDLRAVKKAGPE